MKTPRYIIQRISDSKTISYLKVYPVPDEDDFLFVYDKSDATLFDSQVSTRGWLLKCATIYKLSKLSILTV